MLRLLYLLVTLFALPFSAAGLRAAHKPNVLFICVDDLKPMLGCYGDKSAKSPNIDRLAARGMRFDMAFCNQAVCAPSRNALLTGLRPPTLGIYDLSTNFRNSRPDAVTMPQFFKQNGWHTEAMGKIFHVGHGNHEDPASWSEPHWQANVVAYALDESKAKTGLTREEALFSNAKGAAADLPKGAAYESADVADNIYPDGRVADEAIKRLQAARGKPDQPFFIAVGFVKPHLPFCAPKRYWDMYDPASFYLPDRTTRPDGAPAYAPTNSSELHNYKGIPDGRVLPDDLTRTLIHGYHAAMSYMDAQLGRVLDELDKSGLAKNTIIVLWGDHGWHLGDHGMWCKHTNYEQAAHIPLLVIAPGVTPAASQTSAMVESVDIYPTLCELAGLTAPAGLDGRSFAATLRDPAAPTKDHILHVFPRSEGLGRAIRTPRYRLVEWKKPGAAPDTAEFELYDYQSDPGETKNLATDNPEIIAQLRALLAQHPEAKPQVRASDQGKSAAKGKGKGKGKSNAKPASE